MTLILSPAATSDAHAMEQLIRQAMAPCYARHALQWDSAACHRQLATTRNHWLYWHSQLAGVLRYQQDGHALYLRDLHIVPARRGQGLGGMALAQLATLARLRGNTAIRLRTFADSPALRFYLRHGYQHVRQDGPLAGLAYPLSR